jgi:hypothetical protein
VPFDHYLHSLVRGYATNLRFTGAADLPEQGYRSLYGVSLADAEALTNTGSIVGFKGTVWSERLVLDIDDYTKAEAVEARLRSMELDFTAYDSGGKGAHFEVLRDHGPSHQLPQKDKAWVVQNFPEADRTLYSHLHLYRLPGHVHETTGRRKEIVTRSSGRSLTLPPLARRDVGPMASPTTAGGGSMFAHWRVMMCLRPVEPGYRHENLRNLTYALRDDAQVDAGLAYTVALHVNALCDDPKPEEAVGQIVSSVYKEAA